MENTAPAVVRPLRDDKFLLGILVGIGALLLLALLAIVFLRQPAQELAADTPGGTVQRFLQALERRDYDGAYDYLGDATDKPSREEFARYNADRLAYDQTSSRLRIEQESVSGDSATVVVAVTHFSTGGPFFGSSEWTESQTFALRRLAGTWRITSLPYQYWPPKGLR